MRDALGPVPFDGLPFKLQAKLANELNRRSEVLDDNAHIVHPLECHVAHSTRAAVGGCKCARQDGTIIQTPEETQREPEEHYLPLV